METKTLEPAARGAGAAIGPIRSEAHRRIPSWISETHERAARARAELLRRIETTLSASAPRSGR